MKHRGLGVEYAKDVPLSCVQMAQRRTGPLLEFYGRFIREVALQTLVASAYLQGVEDGWNVLGKPHAALPPPNDYSI